MYVYNSCGYNGSTAVISCTCFAKASLSMYRNKVWVVMKLFLLIFMIDVTHTPCAQSEFQCNNGLCISTEWECDGEEDCINGEDEQQQKCCE